MGLWNYLKGFACIVLLFFIVPIKINYSDPFQEEFESFIATFNKSYPNETEYQKRFEAFKFSLTAINEMNMNRTSNHSATYGLTKFSDMTLGEFSDHHLQSNLIEKISFRREHLQHTFERTKRMVINLPKRVDWREKGVISEVNNQKSCGACWAFSTVENIESMNAIKYGKLEKLSVQQAIDCAGYRNEGCKGGDMCSLLQWMVDYNVTLEKESDYPLHLQNEKCKLPNHTDGVQVNKFECGSFIDKEEYILGLLALSGPVAVAVNALSWQNYLGGIIQFHCGHSLQLLNHAVQIVGYDESSEIPHYIVRNSWGSDFADNGYLYIAIGKNLCGLANEVSALTVI